MKILRLVNYVAGIGTIIVLVSTIQCILSVEGVPFAAFCTGCTLLLQFLIDWIVHAWWQRVKTERAHIILAASVSLLSFSYIPCLPNNEGQRELAIGIAMYVSVGLWSGALWLRICRIRRRKKTL
jgi:hypothetical protein